MVKAVLECYGRQLRLSNFGGLLFAEFTKGETSRAVSHSFGHGRRP